MQTSCVAVLGLGLALWGLLGWVELDIFLTLKAKFSRSFSGFSQVPFCSKHQPGWKEKALLWMWLY